uniref:Reverse transcriptase zinc-binding domain-containing protein n=1 Tax=Brassica oleracea var. oleracea TaxID=109376 RepID=A0A0D3CD31_BRAOL
MHLMYVETSKAKVCWKDLCLPKIEGGLGIRPLKEMNTVFCLKLIWRISSKKASLFPLDSLLSHQEGILLVS